MFAMLLELARLLASQFLEYAIITTTSVCISCFSRCMSAGSTVSSRRGGIVKTRTEHVGVSNHDNMLRCLPQKVSQQVAPTPANTNCQD